MLQARHPFAPMPVGSDAGRMRARDWQPCRSQPCNQGRHQTGARFGRKPNRLIPCLPNAGTGFPFGLLFGLSPKLWPGFSSIRPAGRLPAQAAGYTLIF